MLISFLFAQPSFNEKDMFSLSRNFGRCLQLVQPFLGWSDWVFDPTNGTWLSENQLPFHPNDWNQACLCLQGKMLRAKPQVSFRELLKINVSKRRMATKKWPQEVATLKVGESTSHPRWISWMFFNMFTKKHGRKWQWHGQISMGSTNWN